MDSRFIDVSGVRLHYLQVGDDAQPAVLLLHGWPTSSFLWRHTLEPIAAHGLRAIALDLPGFGRSDKPLDASYSFRYYERILEGFLEALELETVDLAVHDLGGPVGLYWGLRHQERMRALALLNTLAYPRPSLAVVAFVVASYLPLVGDYLVSSSGLELAMKIGLADRSKLTPEVVARVQEPFRTPAARRVLRKTAHALHLNGMIEIARRLPSYPGPVRIIYGARDRILPDVARTMQRVERDLPQTHTTCFEACGHFLQEERGEEIGELLGAFFAEARAPRAVR
jgi:haloalkane dehalogenase